MNDINSTYDLTNQDQSFRDILKQLSEAELEATNRVEEVSEACEVLLLIGGQVERIELNSGEVYHLGRFEEIGDHQIDLSPYNAQACGVSRLHASLFTRGNRLYITDTGSANGTYVAGQRVRSDRPVQLTKGCQILLGLLRIQVMFR